MTTRSNHRRRPARRVAQIAALVFALVPLTTSAAPLDERQVKAVFLYNFARMVDWPAQTSTVTLCVVGQESFGAALDVLSGRPVGPARLQVRRIGHAETGGCQLLFVPSSESERLQPVLEAARGRPILTVADAPGGAERGAVLNFYIEDNKVRFEVNIDAAKRTGLNISSQLLKLARITHDRNRADD